MGRGGARATMLVGTVWLPGPVVLFSLWGGTALLARVAAILLLRPRTFDSLRSRNVGSTAAPSPACRNTGRRSGPGGLTSVAGDPAVRRLFPTTRAPVGIATGAIGGLYPVWPPAPGRRRGSGR
ncbi:hypothetical protein FHS29_003470 [Saccharothrix tamanrassetensis]|uniref:Uncharacterized protein n=1 Tax=Saccharothrix tamanrassetensis TaxID=1051531 RepID=A0A841CLA3_9PSEU|nr:hypothetical protein [Saccharothrix tamanrassetensis]MBB5956877.1 hypothetical protein [Saccharothrix tamanrassetensis]